MTCRHWLAAESRYCRATENVRLYLTGRRCPDHTPARMAGREQPEGESK